MILSHHCKESGDPSPDNLVVMVHESGIPSRLDSLSLTIIPNNRFAIADLGKTAFWGGISNGEVISLRIVFKAYIYYLSTSDLPPSIPFFVLFYTFSSSYICS